MNSLLLTIPFADILPIIKTLSGVVFILVLAYYCTRIIAKGYSSAGKSGVVVLLERIAVGKDMYLLVARVGSKYLLLGTGPAGIQKICELSEEDVQVLLSKSAPVGDGFARVLSKVKEARKAKSGDTEEKNSD